MTDPLYPDDAPVDPDDECLVAYLDGELDRPERADLETRLLDDENLRRRLRYLQQGWDMLGELEGPAIGNRLVESTLELAVADLVPPRSGKGRLGPYRWPLIALAASLIGVGSVLAAGAFLESRQFRRQLNDLAIVENLEAYLHGSDLALMRQLSSDEEWLQLLSAAGEIGYRNESIAGSISQIAETPIRERATLIADLPLEKRAELKSRWERFKLFDPAKRDRIRETADAVAAQADATELLMAMNAYAIWRETIQPPELRDQIESSDLETRSQAIAQAVQESQRQIAERASYMLDKGTVNRIYFLLRRFVQQRVRDGDANVKAAFQRLKDSPGVRDPIDEVLRLTVLRGDSLSPDRPEALTESELKWIRVVLSAKAVQKLDGITGGFQPIESMTLRIWAEEAVRRRYREAKTESTLERYQSLDPSDREVLDLLPPQEILEKLTE